MPAPAEKFGKSAARGKWYVLILRHVASAHLTDISFSFSSKPIPKPNGFYSFTCEYTDHEGYRAYPQAP
ncbi:hypothetical protein B9Z65_4120 [Elsinoe australis]|uniref:Uncharacterized protein n=1 Tax=Elsinoe australis TaxID=40998 RepID=A0A2P7Z1X0_9PEZI|nr:hypothetical protein B9Z65_4120 [Elsinoe australis]